MKLQLLLQPLLFLDLLLIPVSRGQETRYDYEGLYSGVYKHIYPPVDITRDPGSCTPNETVRCPLFLAYMTSFGGAFKSSGALFGVQIALDQINDNPNLLPGYTLHYLLEDSQCNHSVSLRALHTHLVQPPTKIAVVGAGCSLATEPTAEISNFYNLTQISCVSSSTALDNQERYPHHIQISSSEGNLVYGFFGIIKEFNWTRISIITQDENIFTQAMNSLKVELEKSNPDIDIREQRFETDDRLKNLREPVFPEDSRVYLFAMYAEFAIELICWAHQRGLAYPTFQLMVIGWYQDKWWVGSEKEQEYLEDKYGCTVKDREKVVRYTLSPLNAGRTFTNGSVVADSGITGYNIEKLYDEYLNATSLEDVSFLNFYQQCYDATWTMARALNTTLRDLASNETLSSAFAVHNSKVSGREFGLQHFTYNNSAFRDHLYDSLLETEFRGIVGPIKFDEIGARIVSTVDVLFYDYEDGEMKIAKIADVIRNVSSETAQTEIEYIDGKTREGLYPFGVPLDGKPCDVVVGVHVGLSAVFIVLSVVGICFALAGMGIHIIYRKKPVIRLSSPYLNIIVGVGAIILYIDIIITVLPTTGKTTQTVLCNITPWLTSVGYSLCFGTILGKMLRVYYIFDNPTKRKKKPLQDWTLIIGVMLLVAVDAVILLVYSVVEGRRNGLIATRFPHRENPSDLDGSLQKLTRYFIYVCHSSSRNITLGFLYGYKMILQIIALIFAFSIRKVKIKGLNDTKFIVAAVYVTSIVTAIVIVFTYTLNMRINTFAGLFSSGFFIGTTAILGLVLVPPLIHHRNDPHGENIFKRTGASTTDFNSPNPRRMSKRISSAQAQAEKNGSSSFGSGVAEGKAVAGLKRRIMELESKLAIFSIEDPNYKAKKRLDGLGTCSPKDSDVPFTSASEESSSPFTESGLAEMDCIKNSAVNGLAKMNCIESSTDV